MPYVAFLAFCHSSPILLSSQMPYPNRFSNCHIIFLISRSTLHSVPSFLASCQGQNPVPAWSGGEAMHLKWHCSVRVRQWLVLTEGREEPAFLGLLFNLPIMQLIDFVVVVVVHMQDIPVLVHLLIQVLLLPRSASSFDYWLQKFCFHCFPTGKTRRYSIGQIYSEIIFSALSSQFPLNLVVARYGGG